jgi:hypothetical protein
VISARDGTVSMTAVCRHDQSDPASRDDLLAQANQAETLLQQVLDAGGLPAPPLPTPWRIDEHLDLYEHGVCECSFGPRQ